MCPALLRRARAAILGRAQGPRSAASRVQDLSVLQEAARRERGGRAFPRRAPPRLRRRRRAASGWYAGSAGAGTCRRSRSAGRRSRNASASTATRASGHRPRTSASRACREGLDLVRIGEPLRPEFAAWRYGDQLGERMRRMIAATAVGFPTGVALYQVLTPWGLTLVPVLVASVFLLQRRPVAKVRVSDAPEGRCRQPRPTSPGSGLTNSRPCASCPTTRDPGSSWRSARETGRPGSKARMPGASPERLCPW